MIYDLDLYTYGGTIIHNECQSLEDVFSIITDAINEVQLINIQKNE